jgi:hypothetical protein
MAEHHADFEAEDAYIAALEDASGMPELLAARFNIPVDRLSEIKASSAAGSAEWDDPIGDARWLLEHIEQLQGAHELMAAQFRIMQQEKERGWREAERFDDQLDKLRGELDACRRWQAKRVVAISADPIFGAALAEVEQLRALHQAVYDACTDAENTARLGIVQDLPARIRAILGADDDR